MPVKKNTVKKGTKVGVVGYGGAFNMGRIHLNEMKAAGMIPTAVAEVAATATMATISA